MQKDEVVLSANVHNYLKTAKTVQGRAGARRRLPGADEGRQVRRRPSRSTPSGEKRVDWRVKVIQPGQAVVRMKALTDEESDAMEMKFPVLVHGMLKTESFCGVIRPEGKAATVNIRVPGRAPAGAEPAGDALLADAGDGDGRRAAVPGDYPYGCTEQTLNRFLPTVITQKVAAATWA